MQPKTLQPLNVGDILGQTFSAVFRRFLSLFAVSLPPALALAFVNAELQRWFFTSLEALSSVAALAEFGLRIMALGALGTLAMAVAAGFVMLCAAAMLFGKGMSLPGQLLHLIRSLPLLLATTAVAVIVVALPFGVLAAAVYAVPELAAVEWLPPILPILLAFAISLYLVARIWVFLPAVLIGGDGLDAIARATSLSRFYRWPILGAVLLLLVLDLMIVLVTSIGVGFLMQSGLGLSIDFDAAFSPEVLGLNTFVYTLILMLMSVFTVLLYSRLRELKEGLGLGDVAAVFE